MSLFRYIEACAQFATELEESLTEEDIDALRTDFAGISRADVGRWRGHHSQEIGDFLSKTPAERRKMKKLADPRMRRLLTYAAIVQTQQAREMLCFVDSHPLGPGRSYRETAAAAAAAFEDFLGQADEIDDWPFDVESPFSE